MWTPGPTCRCNCYGFPHRLTGGACSGDAWAESYHMHVREYCDSCQLNAGGWCEVGTGQESILHCEAYRMAFRDNDGLNLPINEETFYTQEKEPTCE